MKAGIEDGDLRHWTQQFLDNLHALQFGATVEGCKNGSDFDGRLDSLGDDGGLEMAQTAMDHAVPYYIDIRRGGNRLRLAAPQGLEQVLNGFRARAHRWQVLSRISAKVLDRVLSLVVGPLDLALPKANRRVRWERVPNFVETALLAAGAGVENEDVHLSLYRDRTVLTASLLSVTPPSRRYTSRAKSSPGLPANRLRVRECIVCARPVCCAAIA